MTNKTSSRDKIMMGILALVVVAAAWYMLFLTPTKEKIAELQTQKDNYTREDNEEVKPKIEELKGWTVDLGIISEKDKNKSDREIRKKLKNAKQFNDFKKIADYDNFEALSAEFNRILGTTTESFSLSFEEPVRGENCWRRDISLSFKAPGRDRAKEIVNALNEMENGCFISDITFSLSQSDNGMESANVNCTISIFEYEESEEEVALE